MEAGQGFSSSEKASDETPTLRHNRCMSSGEEELKLMYTNANRLMDKLGELEYRVRCEKPDIIAITETWLTPEVQDSEAALDGYVLLRSDRSVGRKGGGVAIYVASHIGAVVVAIEADPLGYWEILWCICTTKVMRITVGCVYRTPGLKDNGQILSSLRCVAGHQR